jgi:hypothetical protein
MTDAIISQLLDFGALGSFAAFLIWQHIRMQKMFDSLVSSFQSQLKEMDSNYDRRIEIMRDRYDKVIADIRKAAQDKEDKLLTHNQALQGQLLSRERESLFNARLKDK